MQKMTEERYSGGLWPYLLENHPLYADLTDEEKEAHLKGLMVNFDATIHILNTSEPND